MYFTVCQRSWNAFFVGVEKFMECLLSKAWKSHGMLAMQGMEKSWNAYYARLGKVVKCLLCRCWINNGIIKRNP